MGIDQAGDRRDTRRIDDAVCFLIETITDHSDKAIFDVNRVGFTKRTSQVTRYQNSNVLDKDGRHTNESENEFRRPTIAKPLGKKKPRKLGKAVGTG